jgi:hypothetical protein
MYWDNDSGRDLHIFRGDSSTRLGEHFLKFLLSDTDDEFVVPYAQAHLDEVELEFKPLFTGELTGDVIEGHGIQVDTKTGRISVRPNAPPLKKNNFIVEVTATLEDDVTFTRKIRVHVHQSVARMWLTPDALTVRPSLDPPEITHYRFSARAEFDDGTVGDVTLNHGIQWAPDTHVNPQGRLIVTAADQTDAEIEITATWDWINGTVTTPPVRMRIAERWASEASPPTVSIVPGGGWPGEIRPEEVPNVLFLSDGFPDKTLFENATNGYVNALKTNNVLRPYDLLATSINFWRAYVSPLDPGISVRSEVFVHTDNAGRMSARALPVATKPAAADVWDIEDLVYVVGLPVPADQTKDNKTLVDEWDVQVDDDVKGNVNDDLVNEWKKLGNRAFIDEIDSFPGMGYGLPPAAEADDNYVLTHHEDRGGRAQALLPLLQRLASEDGVQLDGGRPIGELWVANEDRFDFDNTDLLILVTSLRGGRAFNHGDYIALSGRTLNADFPVREVTDRKAFELKDLPPPTDVAMDSCRTLAHELSHSFGCGDEYVAFTGRYPDQSRVLSSNLTTAELARDEDGDISGDEIKWNWHRIQKAGVIAGEITQSGDDFVIPLQSGHAEQFAEGDTVLVRIREFKQSLQKQPDIVRNELIHDDPPPAELEVQAPVQSGLIVVSPVIPGSVTIDSFIGFERGSIVYVPTPAPQSVFSASDYPYAEMIGLNVKNAITKRKQALTGPKCKRRPGHFVQTPDVTDIDLPICFSHKARIVGLYEGGARFACRVYRPTGTCMMRNSHSDSTEFCAVCRYVIVDSVNPFWHWQIDRDYAEIYAQG